jgi:predicted phosphodiesterase
VRFVVISDIQANLSALQAVLAAADAEENVERIICAGDIVGLGAYPNEVVELLRERDISAILGNYDDAVAWERIGSGMDFASIAEEDADMAALAWTRETLTPENLSYLRSLPNDLRLEHGPRIKVRKDALDDRTAEYRRTFFVRALFGGLGGMASRSPVNNLRSVLIVHGSPRATNEFVRESTAGSILKSIGENGGSDVVISGHARESFQRDLEKMTFVGVGPTDSTLIGGGEAHYALFDIVGNVRVEFRSVSYDVEAYRHDLARAGLPARATAANHR